MGTQQSAPSTTQKPKWDLPDAWAKNGRCPACGAAGLKVTHLPDYPDYLACSRCQISFEVEDGGRLIRLKYIPDEYEYADAVLHNRWVEAAGLASILNRRPSPPREETTVPPPAHEFSDEETWNRAMGMYRLGNKPKMIQLNLIQSGATQAQAAGVYQKLKKLAEQDARKQSQKFLVLAGASILAILFMAGGWLYASGNLAILLGLATPVPTASGPSAADLLLDLVPQDMKPAIIDLPDTAVEIGRGPGRASCPPSSHVAADLFGGDPSMWQQPGAFAAWQLVNPVESITVTVPSNMTAAYVDNETMMFLSVHGPATIYNANFLVISCE